MKAKGKLDFSRFQLPASQEPVGGKLSVAKDVTYRFRQASYRDKNPREINTEEEGSLAPAVHPAASLPSFLREKKTKARVILLTPLARMLTACILETVNATKGASTHLTLANTEIDLIVLVQIAM